MPEEFLDFNNMIVLRSALCSAPDKDLQRVYSEPSAYLSFLDSVAILTQNDGPFLLFADIFLDKILNVVSIHRFDFDDPEVKACCNDIIDYVNYLKAMPESQVNMLKNNYLAYEEDLRECTFHTTEAFLASLLYDAYVFQYLLTGRQDELRDETNVILSLNYLMKSVPEFFQNPEINQRAMSILNRVGENARAFSARKRHIKRAKETLNSIQQKEE